MFLPMLQKIIFLLICFPWIYCTAAERTITIPTNCDSFKTCYTKSISTDIYRNKIRYLDGALKFWKTTDGDGNLVKALLERANFLIKEAGGETGYKGGDMNLKVSHNKEYKETAYLSAIQDITDALKNEKGIGGKKAEAQNLLKSAKDQMEKL
jgi:hypothetical protein